MMKTTRGRDVAIPSDGLTLQARHWPVERPQGLIVVAHGFGEHGGCYEHVARAIGPGANVDFLAPDLRGHGRSPGRRGFVSQYHDLVADVSAALDWAAEARPGLPLFLLGHSNGGLVTLLAASNPRFAGRLAGMIASNPALELAFPVPKSQLALGRFLLRYAPWVTLPSPVEPEKLTRDPDFQRSRVADPLCHGRMSAPLFFGMRDASQRVLIDAPQVTLPLLMILGGADPVIDPNPTRGYFDRYGAEDKTLLLFPHMLHEPFNELGREQVHDDLSRWIAARLPGA